MSSDDQERIQRATKRCGKETTLCLSHGRQEIYKTERGDGARGDGARGDGARGDGARGDGAAILKL
jgi:hypothetical protein